MANAVKVKVMSQGHWIVESQMRIEDFYYIKEVRCESVQQFSPNR